MAGTIDSDERPLGVIGHLASAVASLAEAWLRDTALEAVCLLSLGTALAGLSPGGAWVLVGITVGLAGAAIAVTAAVRQRRRSPIWLTMLAVAAMEVGVILVMVAR